MWRLPDPPQNRSVCCPLRSQVSPQGTKANSFWFHCTNRRHLSFVQPCVLRSDLSNAVILLGAHNKDISEDTQVRVAIDLQSKHPAYSDVTNDNDIMFFKLAEEVQYNDYISPVCLPPSGMQLDAGTIMQTTGWGNLECERLIRF